MTAAVHRPARLSGASAVLAALGAVAVLVGRDALVPLALEVAGLLVLTGSAALRGRGWRVTGALLALPGVAVVLAALAVAVSTAGTPGVTVVLTVGMVGAFLVGVALVPVVGDGSRRLLVTGAGLVFLTVLAASVVREAGTMALLGAGAVAVLVWDAGEHAINVGEQLGRTARTATGEAVHLTGGAVVAVVGVVAARAVDGAGTPGVPLPSLALLLVAVGLLTLALYD